MVKLSQNPQHRPKTLLFIPLAGLPLLLIPHLGGDYARILAFTILLQATLALSYDVVGGLLGYLHLGHGLFFGLGAYGTALALQNGATLIPALLPGLCLGLMIAIVLSWPLFSLRGPVFALATLGLLFLGAQLARNLSSWTGGAAGLSLPPDAGSMQTYTLSVILVMATTFCHWLLTASRIGLKLVTIREDEDIAESVGINTGRVKRLAFILSALPAAVAGGLYAREISFVIPGEAFGLEYSLGPVLMCLLFRPGTTWGPLLGALTLAVAQELIWTTLPHFRLSLYGLLLITLGILQTRRR